jgi:hypothetical protein
MRLGAEELVEVTTVRHLTESGQRPQADEPLAYLVERYPARKRSR